MRFKISQGNSNGGCGMETIRYKMNCVKFALGFIKLIGFTCIN